MDKKVTREGVERLTVELDDLRQVQRPRIIAAVAEARSHGDLRENAAYDAARDAQALIEKRIQELETLLKNATIVDEDTVGNPNVVEFGNTVVVDFDGEEERYTIVGGIEAKPGEGRISNESPIGKALLGKRVGQRAHVMTPGGQATLVVKRIER